MPVSPPLGIFDPKIFSETELLQIKAKCVCLLTEGKTIMTYSGEGTEAGRQFTMPPADMLAEVVWALKSINPQRYGYITQRVRTYFC